MAEYIEREAIIARLKKNLVASNPGSWGELCYQDAINSAKEIPASYVAPVRHGRWIDRIDTDTPMHECSVCGARVVKGLYEYENPNLYCYRCGARMDFGEEGGTNETDM